MPLKTRDVSTSFVPREGVINLGFTARTKDDEIAQKALSNYALSDVAIYAPGLDEEHLKNSNREVSYSHLLSQMHRSFNSLDNKIQVPNTNDTKLKNNIKTEKELVQLFKSQLEEICLNVCSQEYPNANARFEKDRFIADLHGDAKPVQFDEKLKEKVSEILKNAQMFVNAIQKESPRFQAKTMEHLTDYIGKATDKMAGKKVVIEERSDQEIMQDVKDTIAILIRDDSQAPEFAKVDRKRAMTDLAKKLAPLGMELAIIPIEEKTPQEELTSQVKTCALRAAWDGFIERPKQSNCSPTLRNLLNHPSPSDAKAQDYELNKNDVWKICSQLPEIAEIKGDLQKALAMRGYPTDKVEELSYADMAYLICEYRQPTAAEVKSRQKQNKNEVDGVKLKSSGRAKFFRHYVDKHAEDLKKILAAKGLAAAQIKETLNLMKAGKSNNFLDGHHNFALNDPDAFGKITGESWKKMNNHVVLMDKNSHTLLHAIENNVTAKGVLLDREDDSKTSHRTIFTNPETGKKFYLTVRVKEGIDGLMGLHRETIYNQEYLGKLPPKETTLQTEQTTKTENKVEDNKHVQEVDSTSNNNQKTLQHVKSQRANLTKRKEEALTVGSASVLTDEKTLPRQTQKNEFNGRPNYRGLGKHGGNSAARNSAKHLGR